MKLGDIMKLSIQQEEALNHFRGPALTLAVPGAGKTTVMIHRILKLVEEKKIPADKILSITFSKNQTIDMANRFDHLTKNRSEKVKPIFQTIHAFSYKILRDYLNEKNIRMTLIEGNIDYNKNKLIRQIYFELFHEFMTMEQMDRFFMHYSLMKNKMIPLDEFMKNTNIPHRFNELFQAYEKTKESHHLLDFEDMLHKTNDLLQTEERILNGARRKYPFIQIDEAQDTSPIQIDIINKIAAPENNLFMVADDDQSIYSFRGAEPSYLLNFKSHYPDAKIYFIEENYRSTSTLLHTANILISKNKSRYIKNIIPNKKEKVPIRLIKTKTALGQYHFLIKEFQERNPETTIGILYRNNLSGLALMDHFDKNGISFTIKSSCILYLNHFILDDLLNILIFSENPTDQKTFEKIYYKLGAYISKGQMKYLHTYDDRTPILDRLLDDPMLPDYQTEKIRNIKKVLHNIKDSDFSTKIDSILFEINYEEYLDRKLQLENQKESIDFLIETYKMIFNDCKDYLDIIQKRNVLIQKAKYYERIKSNIHLSTIHRAKGLEYDKVFVIDLIQGEFPSRSQDPSLSQRIQHGEEERRLFYVAMTRAKKELLLLTTKKRNQENVKSSKFYEEVKNTKKTRKDL